MRALPARVILVVSLGISLSGYGQTVTDVSADMLPYVNENGRQGWNKYLAEAESKVFAIGFGGNWAYTSRRPDINRARDEAISKCEAHANPCFAFAIGNEVVWKRETTAEAIQGRVTERLKSAELGDEYAKEKETSVLAWETEQLRPRDFHRTTPPKLPNARTVTTKELRDVMGGRPDLVIVDVLQGNVERASIAGAVLLPGAGLEESAKREQQFAEVMASLVPDKSTPVVFFCLSYECWLSYNAGLRAIRLGYKEVIWYRGGIDAWKAAKLPLTRAKVIAVL